MTARGEEVVQSGEAGPPGRLGLEQDVIAALEGNKACTGNLRCYPAPFFEGNS
jgi:hypothetical protein